MTLVLTAFVMVVGLAAVAIVKLENEKRSEQFARLSKRSNARFVD